MQTLSPSRSGLVAAPSVFITPFSTESIGTSVNILTGNPSMASATYPAANRAHYFPFRIHRPVTVYRFFWVNGTTAGTNNLQVGVYDIAGKSVALGNSVLASGTSQAQFDNITDFVLNPGAYHAALWCNGTTTHLVRASNWGARFVRMLGVFEQSSLAGGLPSTATFGAPTSAYVPVFGLALRAAP